MNLNTPRLLLRSFLPGDLADLNEYYSQPGVGEQAGWKHHTSLAESQRTLAQYLDNPDIYALVFLEHNKVIGHIAVHKDSEENRADTKELGFVLNRDYQNQGLMSEAVQTIVAHLFTCGVEHLYACCFQDNLPSRRLIEKCGFTLEREGSFYSISLNHSFLSYEYVWHRSRYENTPQECVATKNCLSVENITL